MDLTPLNYLLEILLKSYFLNSRCLFIFTDTNIRINFSIPFIYLKVNKTLNSKLIFQHFGCQDIIIHHENAPELFAQFEKLIRLQNERFNLRKFIITGRNSIDIFQKQNELQYVADVLVIVPGEEKYNLMTHTYKKETRDLGEVLLDCWFPLNNSFLFGNDLFPDKLNNQNGRILKLGTFYYEPYSIVVGNVGVHGTETCIILEFVKRYNLTPTYSIASKYLWGDIFPNGTGNGVLGKTLNDEVDIGYGGVYTWSDYYKYLDYTKSIMRSGVTVLVPAPELEAGWLTPLRSFSNKLWEAVVLVFLADTIVLTYIFYKNHNQHFIQDSLITIIKVHLLQSVTFPLRSRTLKCFLALNMMHVLLLSSSYSSGLSSILTVPRYKKGIRTVNDLATERLPWGSFFDTWLISLRNIQSVKYKIIKNNFVVKTEEELIKLSKLHNFGFAMERLPYGHYAVGTYIKRDVISNYLIMKEDLYWEQCSFVVRKNSVLLPLLDSLLLRVFEAGLAAYWQSETIMKYMDTVIQRGIMSHFRKKLIVQLTWVHVQGAFGILLLGYIISTVVFLVEVLKHK